MRIEIEKKSIPSGSLIVRVGKERCTLENDLATIIYVKKTDGE